MDALKLEILSGLVKRTRRRVLENRYEEIMTEDNKTHEYYIVKWYRPPHKFQEDTDIFQVGDGFYNAT